MIDADHLLRAVADLSHGSCIIYHSVCGRSMVSEDQSLSLGTTCIVFKTCIIAVENPNAVAQYGKKESNYQKFVSQSVSG